MREGAVSWAPCITRTGIQLHPTSTECAHSRFLRNAESTPEQSLIPHSGGGGELWEVKGAAARRVVWSHQRGLGAAQGETASSREKHP